MIRRDIARPIALAVVTLDAIGLGLIMPVLPSLLRAFLPSSQVTTHFGILLSLYALMQAFFSPVLGWLSDRYGRRPVILMSLAGAAIDYAVMATAPFLWVLYIGRIISGIAGATGAVANSILADKTQEKSRARWFGYLGTCYGIGMIAGPAIGGVLESFSLHAPFIAASILNGTGFLLAFFFLSETRPVSNEKKISEVTHSFAILRMKGLFWSLFPLLSLYFLIQLLGQLPATLWVIYGEDQFHWSASQVGISLAGYGLAHALFQAFVTGPLATRLGEKRTLLLGMVADAIGFLAMAFITRGWMVPPVLLFLAAGGIGMPALQAMLSNTTKTDQQGTLQGILTSLTNFSSVAGPICFSMLYTASAGTWRGGVWLFGFVLYGVGLLIFCKRELSQRDQLCSR
nr:TetA [uncultured bacterium]